MPFNPPDLTTECLFLAIIIGILLALTAVLQHSTPKAPRIISGVAAWLFLITFTVSTGVVEAYRMPLLPIFMILINLVSLGFALSPIGRSLALGTPLRFLILFQSFRLPLELILHQWAKEGTIPDSMTWTGQNFDIISGVVALIAFPFVENNRAVAWVANLIGFALLLNVMRIAIRSTDLLLPYHLPYALIVPVCIGGALIGHIVLTRKLLVY